MAVVLMLVFDSSVIFSQSPSKYPCEIVYSVDHKRSADTSWYQYNMSSKVLRFNSDSEVYVFVTGYYGDTVDEKEYKIIGDDFYLKLYDRSYAILFSKKMFSEGVSSLIYSSEDYDSFSNSFKCTRTEFRPIRIEVNDCDSIYIYKVVSSSSYFHGERKPTLLEIESLDYGFGLTYSTIYFTTRREIIKWSNSEFQNRLSDRFIIRGCK